MKRAMLGNKIPLAALAIILLVPQPSYADPSKYPQFAQQTLPANIVPSFISIDELSAQLKAGGEQPLILDVRTAEEYREAHIAGALSAPLAEFAAHLEKVPKEGLVVLY
jgi:Rhodanese-like domain